ncbi:MAG TPA: hypothetical protein VF980_02620 [Thermoanaerobaculia bacterium]
MIKLGTLFALFFFAIPAFAQTGATGNWSGTYDFSVQLSSCPGKTFSASGGAAMTLLETGTSISGRLDLVNFLNFTSTCTAGTAELATAIVGAVSGSTITFSTPNDPNGTVISGTINGNTITAQWTDNAGGSGSLTFTRATGDAVAVNATGTWSGTYNFTDRCTNGGTQVYSGPLRLALTQSGSNAGGVVTMQDVPLYDQNCSKITTLTQTMAVSGTVSGSTFTGGVFDPSGLFDFPITATISSTSMNGNVTGASLTNTTGTFTLTQSSTSAPASDLGGTYEGSYTEQDNLLFTCANASSLTFSGPATLTIVQGGSDVAGWLTFHNAESVTSDGIGNCAVIDIGDETLPVYGSVANNTLNVLAPFAGLTLNVVLSFNGNSVTGNLQDSNSDVATFNATRTALQVNVPRPKRRAVRP